MEVKGQSVPTMMLQLKECMPLPDGLCLLPPHRRLLIVFLEMYDLQFYQDMDTESFFVWIEGRIEGRRSTCDK